MAELDNVWGELDEAESAARQTKRPKAQSSFRFNSPLTEMPSQQAARAVKSGSLVGQFKRRTITLPPEQDDYIGQIAEAEGMGKLAMYRWLLDCALSHYEAGERPEKEVIERATARLRHWTSGE
ncbi:MAG: hypothetical protein KC415_05505 [Anaerolineales bacterium]|nr:hypothetical protein [Anaerolineales bacterium]MCA9933357.1 hypothetical protein [Anaerolineales bacterium]